LAIAQEFITPMMEQLMAKPTIVRFNQLLILLDYQGAVTIEST